MGVESEGINSVLSDSFYCSEGFDFSPLFLGFSVRSRSHPVSTIRVKLTFYEWKQSKDGGLHS